MPKKTSSQYGSSSSDNTSQANQFNEYFANVGSELASKIPPVAGDAINKVDSFQSTFDFEYLSEDEVLKTLRRIKNKKYVGLDGISMHILKISAPVIVLTLTYLFNKSFISGGRFPLPMENIQTHSFIQIW